MNSKENIKKVPSSSFIKIPWLTAAGGSTHEKTGFPGI